MTRLMPPRKAHTEARARLHAQAVAGDLDDTPSPASSASAGHHHGHRGHHSSGRSMKRKGPRNETGRVKTGCWSCRIRRKKCRGRLEDNEVVCIDCDRLGIRCLGWGEKRPEWLKGEDAVNEKRAEIKATLLAAGKVKGHRKEEEQRQLKLSPGADDQSSLHHDEQDDASDEDAEGEDDLLSPPGSLPSDEYDTAVDEPVAQTPVLVQGDMPMHEDVMFPGVEGNSFPSLFWNGTAMMGAGDYFQAHPTFSLTPFGPMDQVLSPSTQLPGNFALGHAPLNDAGANLGQDMMWNPHLLQHHLNDMSGMSSPSDDAADPFAGLMFMDGSLSQASSPFQELELTQASSPASSQVMLDYMNLQHTPSPAPPAASAFLHAPTAPCTLTPHEMNWFRYYTSEALPMQYLMMRGPKLHNLMVVMAQRSAPTPPSAMLCVAAVHKYRLLRNGPDSVEALVKERDAFWLKANAALLDGKELTVDKAIIALQLVSVSLFNGCDTDTDWWPYLDVARAWCRKALPENDMHSLLAAMAQDASVEYAAKTTMWMDIFGAISSRTRPRLLNWYLKFFRGSLGGYGGPGSSRSRGDLFKMEEVMGCDAEVLCAFAEIAALEDWKHKHQNELNYMLLFEFAGKIQQQLAAHRPVLVQPQPAPSQILLQHPVYTARHPYSAEHLSPYSNIILTPAQGYSVSCADNGMPSEEELRRLMTNVFRAAARAYLHAVVSGYKPLVDPIQDAVAETISCLREIPSTRQKPVDRSLILPLFLAGILTDDPEHQQFIHARLSNIDDLDVGNCRPVLELIEEVWTRRRAAGGMEVCWRQIMSNMGMKLLFV